MSASRPRVHKDLDFNIYLQAKDDGKDFELWDMRYDPRDRSNKFNAPHFPYHFPYYGPQVAAFLPRVERLCILFRYHPQAEHTWTFDITHNSPPTGNNGYAVTAEDVLGGIYDGLQQLPSGEDMEFSKEHNDLANTARVERCKLFGLDVRREPVRRIDYLKGVTGFCAFAGLDNYKRHMSTPTLRIQLEDVPPKQW
ncbi:hypothetical protein PNOK_0864900 [Pyrrhoderma noxium]|uniref:DUF6699 domain-containing protein n=1 Tax=Pyrrhoderma noxium TaxID=2282107 RepID=A0A286U892_9AGAM|nr:hypothetical protein PNOK_0864900 [Pyrrhoderma noxium]